VLTTVALDHQDWLGETREEIGAEKAGIFRAGAPAVCGETDLPLTVINHAQALSAKLMRRGEVYDFIKHADASVAGAQVWDWQGSCRGEPVSLQNLPLPSLPLVNAATALQALHQLNIDIPESAIREGLLKANLPGRYQRLEHPVPMLLDVAHNPAAAEHLVTYVESLDVEGDIHAIVGIYEDKDIDGVLAPLVRLVKTWHLTDLDEGRAETAQNLACRLAEHHAGKTSTYAKISEAAKTLESLVSENDLILILGSFPVVAGGLEYFDKSLDRV
ncbi:MAG: bifunctional tetrahydrofolate synthase/dihydrofolate synthase, partial [Gammaproteobacteria bacterium]|nr:bifunctional tetrahydrofolate synthase/dihydrofolate synthase [Gammaproteobacteria bacterium]